MLDKQYKDEDIISKNLIQNLPCELSEDEINAKARAMVKAQRKRDEKVDAEKRRKAKAKAEIDGIEAEIEDYLKAIETGKEDRPIACMQVFESGQTVLLRQDNGKEISRRVANPSEAQKVLPGTTPTSGVMSAVRDDDDALDEDENRDDDDISDADDEPADDIAKAKSKKGKSKRG